MLDFFNLFILFIYFVFIISHQTAQNPVQYLQKKKSGFFCNLHEEEKRSWKIKSTVLKAVWVKNGLYFLSSAICFVELPYPQIDNPMSCIIYAVLLHFLKVCCSKISLRSFFLQNVIDNREFLENSNTSGNIQNISLSRRCFVPYSFTGLNHGHSAQLSVHLSET